MAALTKDEEMELEQLRELQSSQTRWLSQWEFDRIKELAQKSFEQTKSKCPVFNKINWTNKS